MYFILKEQQQLNFLVTHDRSRVNIKVSTTDFSRKLEKVYENLFFQLLEAPITTSWISRTSNIDLLFPGIHVHHKAENSKEFNNWSYSSRDFWVTWWISFKIYHVLELWGCVPSTQNNNGHEFSTIYQHDIGFDIAYRSMTNLLIRNFVSAIIFYRRTRHFGNF